MKEAQARWFRDGRAAQLGRNARQGTDFPMVPLAGELPTGYRVPRHHHDQAQLIFASSGVMRIASPDGIWVVPPMRAVWVPRGVEHEIRVSSAVQLRTLLIDPRIKSSLPARCCVIEVSPLLRELIVRVSELGAGMSRSPMAAHLVALILDEIKDFQAAPLHVPMPIDPRLLRICRGILDHPSDKRTCAQWGLIVGASARTLERRFHAQTGISFGAWRRQVRLLAALDQLAKHTPIANIAVDLGYRSVSAFTLMFKRALGRRPSHFFAQSRATLPRLDEMRARRAAMRALSPS
jgi:AraC-like DNA-binding protein